MAHQRKQRRSEDGWGLAGNGYDSQITGHQGLPWVTDVLEVGCGDDCITVNVLHFIGRILETCQLYVNSTSMKLLDI